MQTQKSIEPQSLTAVKTSDGFTRGTSVTDKAPASADIATMLANYSPLVKIIVSRMRSKLPSHADVEELESAGMTGLLAAIERYDSSRGYTFQTYASVRIRGAILDELRAMDMVPRSVRLKQRLLTRTSNELEQRNGRIPSDAEMCAELKMEPKAYEKMRFLTKPVSIVYLDGANESGGEGMHDSIPDENAELVQDKIEREELQELVARKMMELPVQSRKVLALYFNEEMSLAEIGVVMGLSEARICQIRSQALEHLRRFVSRMSAA